MDLTIVIPAYNESRKIGGDVAAADRFFRENRLSGEIIVVDDGSSDDTAAAARRAGDGLGVELIVQRHDENRGKGFAVRSGIVASRGDYVLFADSGTCVPYSDLLQGLAMIRGGQCEIAHGSRKMHSSKISRPQNVYRRICSGLFRLMLRLFFQVPDHLTDTQCGFKLYRGDAARAIYSQCRIDRFMFDVEAIMLAHRLGYRIHEFPVQWSWDPDSRLSPARSASNVIWDLIKIKFRQ